MTKSLLAFGILALFTAVGCDAVRDEPPATSATPPATASPAVTVPRTTAATHPPAAIRFVKGFEAGAQLATSTNKPMLLFFTAEWCRYCHRMAADAFVNSNVQCLAESFVCVEIDADAEPDVCGHFGVRGYPTVLFASPAGTPLNRLVGQKSGRQLASAMQAALRNVARLPGNQGRRL